MGGQTSLFAMASGAGGEPAPTPDDAPGSRREGRVVAGAMTLGDRDLGFDLCGFVWWVGPNMASAEASGREFGGTPVPGGSTRP